VPWYLLPRGGGTDKPSELSARYRSPVSVVFHKSGAFEDFLRAKASMLGRLGRYQDALSAMRQVVEIYPGQPDRRRELADLLDQAGDPEAAKLEREKALASARWVLAVTPPTSQTPHHRRQIRMGSFVDLALVQLALARHDEAFAALDEAVALLPDDPRPRDLRVTIYRDTGRLDDAIAELRCLADIVPDDPTVHERLAHLLHAAGKPEEAERALVEAFARRTRPSGGLYALQGRILEQRGKAEAALTAFRAAAEIEPHNARHWHGAARLLRKAKRPREALEAVAQAVRCEPNEARHHLLLGNIAVTLKQDEVAAAAFSKAAELDPADHTAHYRASNAYWRLRDFGEAWDAARRSVVLAPDNPNYLRHFQRLETQKMRPGTEQ
jgi:tetratricopeptide (TPR) repeat protein